MSALTGRHGPEDRRRFTIRVAVVGSALILVHAVGQAALSLTGTDTAHYPLVPANNVSIGVNAGMMLVFAAVAVWNRRDEKLGRPAGARHRASAYVALAIGLLFVLAQAAAAALHASIDPRGQET